MEVVQSQKDITAEPKSNLSAHNARVNFPVSTTHLRVSDLGSNGTPQDWWELFSSMDTQSNPECGFTDTNHGLLSSSVPRLHLQPPLRSQLDRTASDSKEKDEICLKHDSCHPGTTYSLSAIEHIVDRAGSRFERSKLMDTRKQETIQCFLFKASALVAFFK